MIRKVIKSMLSDEQRRAAKRAVGAVQGSYVRAFKSYDGEDLCQKLAEIGVQHGDTVMVHSNFPPDSGFTGNPAAMVDALASAVGEDGNLLMVSIPFRGSAADYLKKEKTFDVSRTISMMGLVSEVFRRKDGVIRSLHPTHPVSVLGPDAESIVEGHPLTDYPCGAGSPFERLLELDGKILFVDVPFAAMTFFHFLEDRFGDRLPEPVYEDELYFATVKDANGEIRTVSTYAFTKFLDRDTEMLEAEMESCGAVKRGKVGRTPLILVNCEDAEQAMKNLLDRGDVPVRKMKGKELGNR